MSPDAAQPDPSALPPLWRNRDYMLLWSGQLVSTLGDSISGVALPLLVLALTNSPSAAGFIAALGSIPYVVFSLPAGALIDRWDRKRVMIWCDLVRTITTGSIPLALAFNVLSIWQLYAVALIEGTFFVFFNIAEIAALPRVVGKAQLPHATSQNQATFAAASLIGPGLGGVLYQILGRAVPFAFDAVSFAFSVGSLLAVKTSFQGGRIAAPRNLRAEIAEGVRWVWDQPVVRFMAFITGGLNFVNTAIPLIIIVIAKSLRAGEAEIGFLLGLGAVGSLAGSLVAGRVQQRFGFGVIVITAIWLQVMTFPLFALAPNVWVMAGLLLVYMIVVPIYNVAQISYRLSLIPDGLQGRVNSTVRLVHYGFGPVGVAIAGFLLERVGIVPTIVILAGWLLGIGLLVTLYPPVRQARAAIEA